MVGKFRDNITLTLRVSREAMGMLDELMKHYQAVRPASFVEQLIRSAYKVMKEVKEE